MVDTKVEEDWINYRACVDKNTLEEVEELAQILKQEAELKPNWLYTTLVKAECDPCGWCRCTVEWTERRVYER